MYEPFFLWRCCLADLLGSRLLNVAYIQNLQPQGAFIPLAKFNRFPLIPIPLPLSPSFSLSHSVSLLSYSEFNEGEEIKGSIWFYGLLQMMERLAFFFCWMSHIASIHVKWEFSFSRFITIRSREGDWDVWKRRARESGAEGVTPVSGELSKYFLFFFFSFLFFF